MKRRSIWWGTVLVFVFLFLAIAYVCHQSDPLSVEEQIEQDQNLPTGSVTLITEGALEGETEQMLGFFDQEGNPGLAVVSREEAPRLLSVDTSLSSRVPGVWFSPVSFQGASYYVFLSNHPGFALLRVQRGGQWEEIPVPSPPSMVLLPLEDGSLEYHLCDGQGKELSS